MHFGWRARRIVKAPFHLNYMILTVPLNFSSKATRRHSSIPPGPNRERIPY